MKIKNLCITILCLIVCCPFFCINVYAEETKITPILSSNDGCAAYYIVEGTAYPLYSDRDNCSYYVLDGNKPALWSDATKYQQIIVAEKNGKADALFTYKFATETEVKAVKAYTVTTKKSGVGAFEKATLVYSDDGVKWYDAESYYMFDSMGVASFNNKKETSGHKWWGVRAIGTDDEFDSLTEFELYSTYVEYTTTEVIQAGSGSGSGDSGGSGSGSGGSGSGSGSGSEGNGEEEGDANAFVKEYEEYIDKALADNLLYKSILNIIDSIKNVLNEDYSRGVAGLQELGVFNLRLRKPVIVKDFGNEVIGEWTQEWEISNIDYGIDNKMTMQLGWFFGDKANNIRGVKYYSDIVIGGFAWLCFIWYLWHNMPNIVAGDIGQAISTATEINDSRYETETKRITWDNNTGEVIRDTTTKTTKRKVKK